MELVNNLNILDFSENLGLFIAVIDTFIGIAGVCFNSAMFAFADSLDTVLKDKNVLVFPYSAQYSEKSWKEKVEEDDVRRGSAAFAILGNITGVFLMLSCLQIIMSSILVVGICKKSKNLIATWMLFKVMYIGIVLYIIGTFYFVFVNGFWYCVAFILFNVFTVASISPF